MGNVISFFRPETQRIKYEELEFHGNDSTIGKGGYGNVFRGRWNGIPVAVKFFDALSDGKAFLKEVKNMERVKGHPNLISIFGAYNQVSPESRFIVMELSEDGSLFQVLYNDTRSLYSTDRVLQWIVQAAQGLDYLHTMKPKRFVHRDIKPENLLLSGNGETLKICDFGFAKTIKNIHLERNMTINRGTPGYIAPEAIVTMEENNESRNTPYSERFDVFSWAMVFWESLAREQPYIDFRSHFGSASALVAVEAGSRPYFPETWPNQIKRIIIKSWNQSPHERPTMQEIIPVVQELARKFKGQLVDKEFDDSTYQKMYEYQTFEDQQNLFEESVENFSPSDSVSSG